MIRAVVFGFDGVILDDSPVLYRLFGRVLGEAGVSAGHRPDFENFLRGGERECFATALSSAGLPVTAPAISRLVARLDSYSQEETRLRGYPLCPGAIELVRKVATGGIGIGVVSGAIRHEIDGALRQAGIRALVPVIVSGDDGAGAGADPAGYRMALERFNGEPLAFDRLLHPHEVVAIESSPSGIEAAAAAGLRTVGVAVRFSPEALERADAVVATFEELGIEFLLALSPREPGDAFS